MEIRFTGHDTHIPCLAQGDRKRHTQERIKGVALFQAMRTSQRRSVRAKNKD